MSPPALRRLALLASLASVALLPFACTEKNLPATIADEAVPTGKTGVAWAPEQKARIVHAPGEAAGEVPAAPLAGEATSGALPPGHPALPPAEPSGALPPGHPAVPGQEAAAVNPHGEAPGAGGPLPMGAGGGGTLRGTITLAPALAAALPASTTLFIIVRRDAGEGQKGALIASKKLHVTSAAQFPLAYEVSGENVMTQGAGLDGVVRIEARVDQDGDAISKQPGDLVGAHPGAVTVGAGDTDLELKDKL